VVIAESDFGAHVHGLFESKRECLKARTAFVEKYAVAAGKVGRVEKTTRTVTIKDVPVTGNDELVTFSCLPFNDIRGLSFQTYKPRNGDKEERDVRARGLPAFLEPEGAVSRGAAHPLCA